jgi:HEAT repeat protein
MFRHLVLSLCLLTSAPLPAQFLGRDAVSWRRDLESSDADTRRNAAFALGKLGPQAASSVRDLKRCLADDSPKVREAAAFALGEIGPNAADDPDVAPLLMRRLKDDDYRVRRSAAFALGAINERAALDALASALDDDRPAVRQSAIWSLGKLGASSMAALKRGLTDPDAGVRREALTALEPIAKKNRSLFRDLKRPLVDLVGDPESEIRRKALAVLIDVLDADDSALAPSLAKRLRDESYETRRNAALALSKIGGDDALPAVRVLTETLSDPHRDYRLIAVIELAKFQMSAEDAVPALVKLLANRKEDDKVRMETGATLQAIGPVAAAEKAMPALFKILADKSDKVQVRERVLWALRAHGAGLRDAKGIAEALTNVMSEPSRFDNRMLRYDCAYLLSLLFEGETPAKTFDVLEEFLKDDTILIYVNRSSSFSASGSEKGGASANVKAETKGDGRIMAVQALTRIGGRTKDHPRILAQLRRLADGDRTDPLLREETRKLLKSLEE